MESDGIDTHDFLFATLNLSRECSLEDVQRSYKTLARIYHPDRHSKSSPETQTIAESRFKAISRAYEILSDPKLRIIYENFGEEGLRTKFEVAIKTQTAQELRAEFEKLGKKALSDQVENLIKSRADLTVAFDARVLFLPDQLRRDMGGPRDLSVFQKLETVKNSRLFLKHSFAPPPLSDSTSFLLTSQLLTKAGGKGGGNVTISILHRLNSKTNLEIGTTLLRPRALTFKATYAPNNDSFATFDLGIRTFNHPPPINITFGRRISNNNTATVTIRTGIFSIGNFGKQFVEPTSNSTLSMGLISNRGWNIDVTTGVEAAQVSLDYGRKVLGGIDFRVGGSISSQGGFSNNLSATKELSENVKGSLIFELGADGLMTVKLRLRRLGQSLILPVIISSSLNSTLAVGFTVIPAVSMIALNHYYLAPRKSKKVKDRILELREENAEYIQEKKKEAEDAILLLREYVMKQVEIETRLNGIIIVEATYGIFAPPSTANSDQKIRNLDVTIPIQALVQSSQLIIPGGRSKSGLLGFYDVAIGEEKRLKIRYLFKEKLHEVECGDRDGVAIPLRSHAIGN